MGSWVQDLTAPAPHRPRGRPDGSAARLVGGEIGWSDEVVAERGNEDLCFPQHPLAVEPRDGPGDLRSPGARSRSNRFAAASVMIASRDHAHSPQRSSTHQLDSSCSCQSGVHDT